MITFKVENRECIKEIRDLCELWWDDSLFAKTYKVKYDPDVSMYENLYDSGLLLCICGRNSENTLVACYMAVITPYQFNPSLTIAAEIVWCVHPKYQKSGIVIKLISSILKELEKRDVNFATLALPNIDEYKSLGRWLEKKKFILMDNVYFKEII